MTMGKTQSVMTTLLVMMVILISSGAVNAQQEPSVTAPFVWSPDSQRLAVGYADGVRVAADGVVEWAVETSNPVAGLLFSTDGKTLYGVTSATDVYAWDVATGELQAQTVITSDLEMPITNVSFVGATDSHFAFAMGSHFPIGVFLLDKELNLISQFDTLSYRDGLLIVDNDVLTFHVEGTEIAIQRDFQPIATAALQQPLSSPFSMVRVSGNGQYLFVQAAEDAPLEVFETTNGERIMTLPSTSSLQISATSGDCLTYSNSQGQKVFYNLSTGELVAQYPDSELIVGQGGYLHDDGQTFTLVRLDDCTVHTLNIVIDKIQFPFLRFAIGNDKVAMFMTQMTQSISYPTEAIIYDLAGETSVRTEVPSMESFSGTSIVFKSNKVFYAVSSGILVLDTETGEIVHQQLMEVSYPWITLSPDGRAYAYPDLNNVIIRQLDGSEQVIVP